MAKITDFLPGFDIMAVMPDESMFLVKAYDFIHTAQHIAPYVYMEWPDAVGVACRNRENGNIDFYIENPDNPMPPLEIGFHPFE